MHQIATNVTKELSSIAVARRHDDIAIVIDNEALIVVGLARCTRSITARLGYVSKQCMHRWVLKLKADNGNRRRFAALFVKHSVRCCHECVVSRCGIERNWKHKTVWICQMLFDGATVPNLVDGATIRFAKFNSGKRQMKAGLVNEDVVKFEISHSGLISSLEPLWSCHRSRPLWVAKNDKLTPNRLLNSFLQWFESVALASSQFVRFISVVVKNQ